MVDLSNAVFVFAHGAGAGINSDFIVDLSNRLVNKGIEVTTFEFPYMQKITALGKRRPPDRMPKLIDAYAEIVKSIPAGKQIFIGGKSMGGRVASLLASEQSNELAVLGKMISGVICLGFPFHPPKQLEKYRGEHLTDIETPTLIIQGDRDNFGTKDEVLNYQFSSQVQLAFLPDGDHSFKPRVRSGGTLDQNINQCTELMIQFIEDQLVEI